MGMISNGRPILEIQSNIFFRTKNIFLEMISFVFFGLFVSISLALNGESLEYDENIDWKNETGGTIWYRIGPLPMNYSTAYEYCRGEGGMLAEPRDSFQTEDINRLLNSNNSYWIGLTDLETEALFLWNSNRENTESYHNWHNPDEPNGSGDCCKLWGNSEYGNGELKWDDDL